MLIYVFERLIPLLVDIEVTYQLSRSHTTIRNHASKNYPTDITLSHDYFSRLFTYQLSGSYIELMTGSQAGAIDPLRKKDVHLEVGQQVEQEIPPFQHQTNYARRFIDSLRRAEHIPDYRLHSAHEADETNQALNDETAPPELLKRKLSSRHLQMIAIGGSIGTGLFVGSGLALSTGGPAALFISFTLIGLMMFCVIHALGELAVMFPIAGSFSVYSTRFIDPAWGFSMGWNYAMQWLVVFPLELTAAEITIAYWNTGLHEAVWITLFMFSIIFINLFGVKGYGEAEFIFSIIKVVAVIGFIIVGIAINCGGAPNGKYYGVETWSNPGAFANGFKGLCQVFVTAAFAFGGTELCGLAAAETSDPRRMLPRAIKQVFWRITLFYIVSLLIIGFLVPFNDPKLLSGTSSVDINASPFVIAIQNAGIPVLPHIMNAVIFISVMSVGNSSTFGSSRTLAALAQIGQAPKIFAYIDRHGRPIVALSLAFLLGTLAYINVADVGTNVFDWLLALSGLSSLFTWGSICFAHIRFRKAWEAQGYKVEDIPFKAALGVAGSWLGVILVFFVLLTQFYVAIFPVGGQPSAKNFFQVYAAAPIVLTSYGVWKYSKGTTYVKSHEADLITGRKHFNLAELKEQEREEQAKWGVLKR